MAKLIFSDHAATWRTGHDYPNVHLTKVSIDTAPEHALAYVFFGHVNVDFDGSPTAYGPPGITPPADDDLRNAWDGSSGWFGVVALPPDHPDVLAGRAKIDQRPELEHGGKYPVIQQEANEDPNPGYYVSCTPHASGPIYRQDSYVDASRVAFGALSGRLKALGVSLGDYALAIRHERDLQSAFYFADVGGNNYALGECSHRVGKDLGGSGRGNSFNNNFPVSFIVFPESGTQDPSAIVEESDEQIGSAVSERLAELANVENPEDLPRLMGWNEVPPPNEPRGLAKLQAYLQTPGGVQDPPHYEIILGALRRWGYGGSGS